jgi:hypothetical protein
MKFPRTIALGSCAKRLAGTLCLLVSPTALWTQQPAVDKEPKVEFVALPDLPLRWAGQKATIEDELSEVLLQPPCETYQKSAEAEDALKTFLNHEFTFQYASLLASCQKKEFETGDGYSWEPNSCDAYFPVCDDQGSQGGTTLACIAYPKEKFQDAPTFEAAAFSVASVEGTHSEKDCLGGSPDWAVDPRQIGGTVTINGAKFKAFEVGDAGMSQSLGGHVYRTFHAGKCLQLAIRWAMASEGAFDEDSINKFTKEDADKVRSRLEQARDSFQFVK